MASYATADSLRAVLALPTGTADAGFVAGEPLDDLVQETLDSATEQIDEICGRSFQVALTTGSDRVFRPTYRNARQGSILLTDDFAEVPTAVAENGETVAADMWYAVKVPTSTRAGQHLRFPQQVLTGDPVTVTARWGWPAVPNPIKQACLMIASKLYMRQKTPLGIHVTVTQAEVAMAYLPKRDHHVMELLDPYIRARVA